MAYRLLRKRRARGAGRLLRAKIKRAGVSYADIARLAGCSVSMVDKVCHHEKKSDRITRIINALDHTGVPPRPIAPDHKPKRKR